MWFIAVWVCPASLHCWPRLFPGEGFPTVLEKPWEPGKCLAQSGFMGLGPGQLVAQPRAQKGPALGFMLCCGPLEILNNFGTTDLAFLFFSRLWVMLPVLPGEPPSFHLCSFSSCFDVALGFALSYGWIWVYCYGRDQREKEKNKTTCCGTKIKFSLPMQIWK